MLTDDKGRIPEVTLECMRYLRRRFPIIKISVEVEKPGRAGLEDLAAEADVVFYSKSWAKVSHFLTFFHLKIINLRLVLM